MTQSGKNRPPRAATLADVGREAGVSAMAASAVLNGARTSSRIASDTRARIMKAAAKLRYRPNAAARALAKRRMDVIGIAAVIDSEGGSLNQYFLEIFNGVIEAAAHHGQNATVFTLHDWKKDTARLAGFCDGRIDGMILVAPLLGKAAVRELPDHTPFVALHANNPLPGIINLESDEEAGFCQIVKHLIAQGHRRIVHLSGQRGLLGAERRIRGYRRALAEARIPFDPERIVETVYSETGGQVAMRAWLRRHAAEPLPDAVCCANDAIAIGCMEALAEIGSRVPEDVSVTGFDDTLAARTTVPQLTTVRQPLRAMGAKAVDVLLGQIRHHHGHGAATEEKELVVFPTELVLRSSVAPPPPVPKLAPR